jgi:hypothetical protein
MKNEFALSHVPFDPTDNPTLVRKKTALIMKV